MIPLLTGIGIGIRHLQMCPGIGVSLESELESGFQSKPGIGIGIKTVPELCITDEHLRSFKKSEDVISNGFHLYL